MDAALTAASLGENALVERLHRLLPKAESQVLVGPGDDCAVVSTPGAVLWELLKVDSVVEGVHFESAENMQRVGWKALCRAISDVAAMGGVPRHALVSLAVPPNILWSRLRDLYLGLGKAGTAYGVSVVGGETVHTSGPLVCSVFLTGSVEPEFCIRRAGGRPGDVLFVTGRLGGSLASGRHLDFQPRLDEGRWLAQSGAVRAMMDISDGLASDMPRLARASGCGVELDPGALPLHHGCTPEQAWCDGEDFELLVAVEPAALEEIQRAWHAKFPTLAFTLVGRLLPIESGMRPASIFSKSGYDHFQ